MTTRPLVVPPVSSLSLTRRRRRSVSVSSFSEKVSTRHFNQLFSNLSETSTNGSISPRRALDAPRPGRRENDIMADAENKPKKDKKKKEKRERGDGKVERMRGVKSSKTSNPGGSDALKMMSGWS